MITAISTFALKGGLTRFLTSTPGLVLMAVFAFGGWTWYQRHDAAREASLKCHAEHKQAADAEKIRQADAARKALQRAAQLSTTTQNELESLRVKAADLQRQLQNTPEITNENGQCNFNIPADVRRRLLDIR